MHSLEAFLGQLEARKAVLVEERANAFARRQAALDNKRERKARTFSPQERVVYGNAMRAIGECDEQLAEIQERIRHQKAELQRAGKGNATVEALYASKARVAPDVFPQQQLKRMHQAVLQQESYRIEGRDFSSPDSLLPSALWPTIVGPAHENRILNRLPLFPLDAPSVEIVRHNSTTGAAQVVSEGAVKPEIVMETERIVLAAQKLAAHTAVSWEIINDWYNFVSYVQGELFRQVTDVENAQLLSGTGSGQLAGFLQTPGILSYTQGGTGTTPTDETSLDAIEAAIATLRTGPALAETNLLILHPVTWSSIRRSKDNYGRYLVQADPTQEQAESVWGVPVLTTTQQELGVGLMLDTTKFGRCFVRDGLSLRTGYMNDDLVRNLTRFVAEERLLLSVEKPAAVLALEGLPVA